MAQEERTLRLAIIDAIILLTLLYFVFAMEWPDYPPSFLCSLPSEKIPPNLPSSAFTKLFYEIIPYHTQLGCRFKVGKMLAKSFDLLLQHNHIAIQGHLQRVRYWLAFSHKTIGNLSIDR